MTWENPGTTSIRCFGLGFLVGIQLEENWMIVYVVYMGQN